MKNKLRIAAIAVLALVFAGSMAGVILRLLDYRGGAEDYSEAETMVGLPTPPPPPSPAPAGSESPGAETGAPEPSSDPQADYEQALRKIDLTALRDENPDVVAWIVIPDTPISYPVVQGRDNQYYLNHTWKGVRRAVGAIFMEYRSNPDMSDFNTIIYGHRMSDNSMFHALLSYAGQPFWAAHHAVYIAGDGVCRRYEIFSAYEASTTGDSYRREFGNAEDRQSFLDYCLEHSVIETGVVPGADDHILTLSTCTDSGSSTARWVVHAVLAENGAG